MAVSGAAEDRRSVAVVYEYLAWAVVWLLVGSLYGVLAAWKFVFPDLLPVEWLSFGRIRPIHTDSILSGWLSIGLIGLGYLVVYRTAGRPLFSPLLARIALALLNLALLGGLVTLSLGMTRGPLEYREWVTPVAAFFGTGVILNGINIFLTLLWRRTEELYISNWFILGAFAWVPILYFIAYLPAFDSGMANVVIQAYYMHVVLGLWFTPMVLGITYWVLPRLLRKPIYSYALGVLAFWTNLVFYPLIGAHHFVFSPLPWWLQSTAIALGVGMLVPVIASSANFLLTMKGSWRYMRTQPATWFVLVSALCYAVASAQGSLQGLRTANALLHFSNNTVGHAHFATYGFVAFLMFGAIYGESLFGEAAKARLHIRLVFWLSLGGMALYVVAMTAAGLLQGLSWAAEKPFIDSVAANAPWYLLRAIGGSAMALGHIILAWDLLMMRPQPQARIVPLASPEPAQ